MPTIRCSASCHLLHWRDLRCAHARAACAQGALRVCCSALAARGRQGTHLSDEEQHSYLWKGTCCRSSLERRQCCQHRQQRTCAMHPTAPPAWAQLHTACVWPKAGAGSRTAIQLRCQAGPGRLIAASWRKSTCCSASSFAVQQGATARQSWLCCASAASVSASNKLTPATGG